MLTKLKLSAKAYTIAIAIVTWFLTQPGVVNAVGKFSAQHHWAVALGTLLTLLGHLFYQPTKGA